MITIISATNRPGSLTLRYARQIQAIYREISEEDVKLLDLEEIDHAYFLPTMYNGDNLHPVIAEIQAEYILGATKLVFIAPEYNGSFPGTLKTFIDAISVHRYPENFSAKPVALIGISSGRAGNLRGLDHLADVLLHMGAHLMSKKLPISLANKLLDETGQISDPGTVKSITTQAKQLISI